MFSQMSSFFPWVNSSNQTDKPDAMFAGLPLVNPLLNDASQNIEALDERIAQLESVSQWLNMNLQMVNSAVQQLQVQKQTLLALAQWQAMSKDALGELAKINPFSADAQAQSKASVTSEPPTESDVVTAKKSKSARKQNPEQKDHTVNSPDSDATLKMPAAIEQLAQSWWDGLQNQFAQLAHPLVGNHPKK